MSDDEGFQDDAMDIDRPTSGLAADDRSVVRVRRDRLNKETLPWVEKYRPSTFEDLVAHQDIINTLRKLVHENKLPHILLYGPPGTGKTSTVLTIAREMNGPNYQQMILELNASDDRNIRIVREEIKDFASTRRLYETGVKLIVLDEADALTNDAQAALRRVIEKYTKNTRFCLICNYVNKVIPAIQSRCTKFRFGPLADNDIRIKLDEVVQKENVNIDEGGLKAIIKLAGGDMRKVLNVLQSCHMAFQSKGKLITEDRVYKNVGHPSPRVINDMVTWLFNESFEEVYNKITEVKTAKGYALQDIITEVAKYVTRIKMDNDTLIGLVTRLADVEHRLASGTSEKMQLSAVIGAFQIAREQIAGDT